MCSNVSSHAGNYLIAAVIPGVLQFILNTEFLRSKMNGYLSPYFEETPFGNETTANCLKLAPIGKLIRFAVMTFVIGCMIFYLNGNDPKLDNNCKKFTGRDFTKSFYLSCVATVLYLLLSSDAFTFATVPYSQSSTIGDVASTKGCRSTTWKGWLFCTVAMFLASLLSINLLNLISLGF
jgi:hypothetical protein